MGVKAQSPLIRITAILSTEGVSPRELRKRFSESLRVAILHAIEQRRVDWAAGEELLRTLPAKGRA